MKNALLLLSAVLGIMSVFPYCFDIWRKKSKPNLVSWITWTLLSGITTSALIAAGQYRAAFFAASATIAPGLVVLFGLRHGYVKYSRFDVICQISAIFGIILWQLFDDPVLAVIASVTIDLIGAAPTVRHSWYKPFEETWQTYALSVFTISLGIAGLETYDFINLIYPVYLFILCSALTIIIVSQRQRMSQVKTSAKTSKTRL